MASIEEELAELDQPATDSPAPEVTFADLGLSQTILDAVSDLGYTTPTPVQAASIPQVLAGRDLLAAAQTGTGKTAAFLLPTMNGLGHVRRGRRSRITAGSGPLMLVITPTRELAQQIDDVCTKVAEHTGHKAVTVVGGLSYNPQKSALKNGCDILVATPGRLEDLINQGACMLNEVQVLVLDEADRMLDMGFLPSVRRIVKLCPEKRQTLLFSATLDEKAVGSITDLVKDPAKVEIAPATATADTVDQFVLPVTPDAKNGLLDQVLQKFGPNHVIVFCRTKRRAETVARRLSRDGISTAAIHGDRSQAQRERALKAFREGKCDVLVATDVLARGIDISDVSYVVNFDVPEEPVDYIHRIGRTGRAGEEGWSVTFVTNEDIEDFYDIEALMGKTADLFAPEDLEGLDRGSRPVHVDPDRVPRDHVRTKKEKKRARTRAKKDGSSTSRRSVAKRQRDRVAADKGQQGAKDGQEALSVEASPVEESKPSRRKRSGRVRVRDTERTDAPRDSGRADGSEYAGEGRDGRWHADAPARGERAGRGSNRGNRSRDGRPDSGRGSFGRGEGRGNAGRGGFGRGRDEGRGGTGRGGAGRSFGRGNGSRGNRDVNAARGEDRNPRDDWRNYDEPQERRGRGGSRAGRAGGRDNRGSYGNRQQKRGGRRPGDNGGRR